MWFHIISAAQSGAGGSPTTVYGIIGSGVFGVAIVAIDRWISKRRPRAESDLRNQARLDKEWNDLFDKVNNQYKECQKESEKLRSENQELKTRIDACEAQIEKLLSQIATPPHA